jgi:hypothetical protein
MRQSSNVVAGKEVPAKVIDRRTLVAGAGTVGALAAAATLLPAVPAADGSAAAFDQAKPTSDTAAGYRLSEHVKRYYATTKI